MIAIHSWELSETMKNVGGGIPVPQDYPRQSNNHR
jgi:hypothetical protein